MDDETECPICMRNYSELVKDSPANSDCIEINCKHWLCTDCWQKLYDLDQWHCPFCRECLCDWISSHYPINPYTDSGTETDSSNSESELDDVIDDPDYLP